MLSAVLRLTAHTRVCDPYVFEEAVSQARFVHLSNSVAILGVGTALEVEASAVGSVLGALSWAQAGDGLPSHRGPLVVGALGYLESTASTLWVPCQIFGRDSSGTWCTTIGEPADGTVGDLPVAPSPALGQVRTRVALPERDAFIHAVGTAVEMIRSGTLEKVVLARREVLEFDQPISRSRVLANLVSQQPGCVVFAVDDVVGASPELLVRKSGDQFESAPIAGTAAPEEMADLARSEKDLHEHEFVIAAMREALARFGAHVDEIGAPEVEVLADVAHLITHISGRSPATSLELAQALHPTPAVAGTPTAQAVAVQRDLEGFDRGIYAGPVGWVDACGDGEWMLALRSAQIDGALATLFTGAGIVAGSDPHAEWAETESKLAPMRRALGA